MSRTEARVTVRYSDGELIEFPLLPGQSILEGARRHKVEIASDCEAGDCQTCLGQLLAGEVATLDEAENSLTAGEQAKGAVLCCVSTATSPEVGIGLSYSRGSLIPARPFDAVVVAAEPVSRSVVRVVLRPERRMRFLPGQYARLIVPPEGHERAYSMANAPGDDILEFYLRLLPAGVASNWAAAARPGERMRLRGPYGTFYLRHVCGTLVMVAGGTGLAPMLAMLRHLSRQAAPRPEIILCYGVTSAADLFGLMELEELAGQFAAFDLRIAAIDAPVDWARHRGVVTDLLRGADLARPDGVTAVYLCGPPAMVTAASDWFDARGFPRDRVNFENFSPSGD